MKLSTQTIKILKNFSEINPTLLVHQGSNLVTIDHNKRIIADAKVPEVFPVNFAIYDLNQFLSVSSFFDNPEFEFTQDRVLVKSTNRQMNYIFADPSCVTDATPTRNKLPTLFKEEDIVQTFSLSEDELKSIRQAASVLKYPHLTFMGDGGGFKVVGHDISNDSLGDFVININNSPCEQFQHTMLLDNLRVVPGSYTVAISPKIAHVKNVNLDIRYWVVMDAV